MSIRFYAKCRLYVDAWQTKLLHVWILWNKCVRNASICWKQVADSFVHSEKFMWTLYMAQATWSDARMCLLGGLVDIKLYLGVSITAKSPKVYPGVGKPIINVFYFSLWTKQPTNTNNVTNYATCNPNQYNKEKAGAIFMKGFQIPQSPLNS